MSSFKKSFDSTMRQITLVGSELSTNDDDIIQHMVNNDNRIRQKEPESSSSPISKCQSSLTIPYETTTTNTPMLNNNKNITVKSPSRFSYLIRQITPCIFGTENYDDKSENDDEFFLTAGGIVHSCPNIYELLIEDKYEHRKYQSCNNLMFINQPTTSSINNNLNTYDTEFDRYSIIPRFQPISSSLSTDSINSEIELYKERHANGLSRRYENFTSTSSSSFLPTTWKSDNYLFVMSVLHHHHQSSLSISIDSNQRSRSFDIPIRETISSILS